VNRLIRAEFRKIFTTRLWWAMLLGAAAFATLATIGQLAGNGVDSAALMSARTQQAVFASATFGDIFTLVVGVIAITTEYRHFTSRPTFLSEPRRGRIVVAKMVAYAILGLGYATACIAVTVAVAVPWLATEHTTVEWQNHDLIWVIAGDLATITAFAVFGLGVGVLVRNQIAAVIAALAYLLVLGPVMQVIPGVKVIYRWLPGAAADAVTDVGHFNDRLLNPWEGLAVFLAWGVLFALSGWWFTVRRDIP